jgi:hypothetical protein
MAGMFSFLSRKNKQSFQIQSIGQGEFGPKSRGLLDDRKRAIKAGISFPSLVPITSEIFNKVAGESGALKAKNELDAFKCLYKYELQPELVVQITEDALSFGLQNNGGRAVMVRADDYPLGLGLTYSGAAAINSDQDEKLFSARLVGQLKRVWASTLSENFKIFAKMKGLNDVGAAMLMPVFGVPVISRKHGGNDLLYTPISINFLGYFGYGNTAVFSVGAGIGGANRRFVSLRFRKNSVDEDFIRSAFWRASYEPNSLSEKSSACFAG